MRGVVRDWRRRAVFFYAEALHELVNFSGVLQKRDDSHFAFAAGALKRVDFIDAFNASGPA